MFEYIRFTVADVSLHLLHWDLRLDLLLDAPAAHVDAHDVPRDSLVPAPLMLVTDDEDHVETGQDGRLEVDVFAGRLHVVVPAEDRVRGRQDGRSRVEDGGDAGLSDRDGLLLHGFVDGDLVADVHLVELVNAANASSILGFQVLNQLGALALVWWNDHLRQASGHQPQW